MNLEEQKKQSIFKNEEAGANFPAERGISLLAMTEQAPGYGIKSSVIQ